MKDLFKEIYLSYGVNYFSDDCVLKNIIDYFDFNVDNEMHNLGNYVSTELIEGLDYIDHYAKPELQTWSITGKRIDYVRLSPHHREMLSKLQNFGIIRNSIKNDKISLINHFLSGYVISDSGIFCTFTLTEQTLYGLFKYGSEQLKAQYLNKFIDVKNPWYGATFYSELQGGSDIGNNNTLAVPTDGHYTLNGRDKYFASDAGIADASIVTAKTDLKQNGAKYISVYFVPAYFNDTLNYNIRRLKNKMGTVAVPTGEVEMNNSIGYILGDIKNGIYIAMEILTISRIDDAIAATGIARKALWEAYKYANIREAFGKKLIKHPLMRRDFIENEINLEAATILSFAAASSFEKSINSKPPYDDSYNYARILSHISKNMASSTANYITEYAMEMMGGIGFFEEFPMAKFHRDSIVTSIWEGTSNIQAIDAMESLFKKDTLEMLMNDMANKKKGFDEEISSIMDNSLEIIKGKINNMRKNNPEFYAKELLNDIGKLMAGVYLLDAGLSTNNEHFIKSGKLYFYINYGNRDYYDLIEDSDAIINWMNAE